MRGNALEISWPGPIHDGYYGSSMFDVIDSMDSVLRRNSSHNGFAAHKHDQAARNLSNGSSVDGRSLISGLDSLDARVQCADEIRELQRKLAMLEDQFYGSAQVEHPSQYPDRGGGAATSTPYPWVNESLHSEPS